MKDEKRAIVAPHRQQDVVEIAFRHYFLIEHPNFGNRNENCCPQAIKT
jgi:hypothetical protein